GHVVLAVDDVVPERLHGASIIGIVRLHRDVGHARVAVYGADRMAYGLILLDHRQMALVVLGPLPLVARGVVAIVEQELGEVDVLLALGTTFHVVHEAAKADERLLHLLVAIVPGLLRRGADVVVPAVRELL